MADPITLLMLAGTAVSTVGTIATGQAENRAAQYEAKVDELNAKNARASAQASALDYIDQKRRVLSRLQNNAASGGFTGTDKTAMDLTGEIERYGTYESQMAQYGGNEKAAGYEAAASAARARGKAAATGSMLKAGASLVSGFGQTLFDKYGYGAPSGGGGSQPFGAFSQLLPGASYR